MPLVKIYTCNDRSASELQKIGDCVHECLMKAWGIPEKDRFHIFMNITKGDFQIDPHMWDANRSDRLILLHIFTSPRSKESKLAFYKMLPELLNEEIQLSLDDVFIPVIIEDVAFSL